MSTFFETWFPGIRYFGMKNHAYEFVENLSYFLASGLPIAEALLSLEEESSSRRMRAFIRRVRDDIEEGVTLSASFEKQHFFEENVIEVIRAGEISGNLTENLKFTVLLNDKDRKLKAKINSSLLYGSIVLVMTAIVGVGTAWFTLPRIANVYAGLNATLPLPTRILVDLGHFVSSYGFILFPVFFFFISSIFYFLFSFPKTKFIGNLFLFHLPLIGRIIRQSEMTRMGYFLGNALGSGISIDWAFRILIGTTTFENYKKLYRFVAEQLAEGFSLSESFSRYPKIRSLLPSSVLFLIASAERTGKLPDTFFRVSELYEQRLENTSKNLPIIIEPILLIFVGLFVAAFILATMLPVYNLTNIIR